MVPASCSLCGGGATADELAEARWLAPEAVSRLAAEAQRRPGDIGGAGPGIGHVLQGLKAGHQVEISGRKVLGRGHLEPKVLGTVNPRVGGSVLNGWGVEVVAYKG